MKNNYSKQILAVFLAIMSLSLSLSVFAQNNTELITYGMENQKNTEERGFIIKDGGVYDLSGRFLFNVSEDGQLDNGDFLDENFSVGYPRSEWSGDAIDRAVEKDFIPVLMRYDYVYSINRHDFAVITYNMLEKTGKLDLSKTSQRFTDTSSQEITTLAEIGIVSGKSDTLFEPDSNLTREEAATILARICDYVNVSSTNTQSTNSLYSDDNKISDWAKNSVYKLRDYGIMQGEFVYDAEIGDWGGYSETVNFNPKSEITKEECIVAIMRIYDLMDK